jgi:hypothetical protein
MYRGAVHVWVSYHGGHTVVANDVGEAAPTPPLGGYVTGFGYDGGILFASRMGEGAGVLLSTHLGLEWQNLEVPETPGAAASLEVDPDGVVYVQEVFGPRLLRLVRGGLSAEPAADEPGVSLSIAPNPATGPATIWVETNASGEMTVEVLDVLGRRVRTLHAGPASERTRLRLPDGLPPGPYFIRAHTCDGSTVRAFIRR